MAALHKSAAEPEQNIKHYTKLTEVTSVFEKSV
jgi:hypothetical protein